MDTSFSSRMSFQKTKVVRVKSPQTLGGTDVRITLQVDNADVVIELRPLRVRA